ncbi:MAG: helix-turn-helix domain-containing protein, partial [Bacteroidetes bacterium]|nr:helix-turn-helix domain-containing protein [Bacteroidota bacterium]
LYYGTGDLVKLQQFALESGQPDLNLEKLQRIQHFAEADVCRRRVLISYFGEPFTEDCGNCDVCHTPRRHFDGTTLTQKAVSALLRLGEKCGSQVLIDVLRGSRRHDILEKGYHKIRSYGCGADLSYPEWQTYLLQLLNLGVFEIAYDEGFSLKVTDYGKDIVYGRVKIQLVKQEALPAYLPKRLKKKFSGYQDEEMQSEEEILRELLRKTRKRLARKEGVPGYMIFNDVTLEDLILKRPSTPEELNHIRGISVHKAEKYGTRILDALEGIIPPPARVKGQTYQDTLALYQQGLEIEEIARQRGRHVNTIFDHLEHLINTGEPIDISRLVSPEQMKKIEQAYKALNHEETLKEYFDYLNEEVPYPLLRLGLAKLGRRVYR